MILKKSFYSRPTLEVAKDLLGCYLVRRITPVKSTTSRGARIGEQFDGVKEIRAVITDVEAYIGEDDLACHASKGRTPRSEVLYGEAGHAYVYLIYGMYYIMNVVTEKKDFPAAVMIRAIKIEGVDYAKTNGPGKVCREMKIGKEFHDFDITSGGKLWIERGKKIDPRGIISTTRVGIAYAEHCALYPWRFVLKEYWGKK